MSSAASPAAELPDAGRLTTGLLLAAIGAVLFSGKAIVIKLAYRYGVDAETLLALRMLLALPFFAAALVVSTRGAPALTARDHLRLWAIGLSGYYLASYLDFLGLQYVSAALERLILYLNPTVVLLLSALWLRRRIARGELAALGLSYAGIVLVFWHDLRVEGRAVALGAALVFAATVCYAFYLVLAGELVRRIGAVRLTAYAMCVATLGVLLQFAALRPLAALAQPAPVWWLSAFNAVACTVVPVFATMLAVARIGASRVALMGMVGPIATIALGYVFLGEAISSGQLAGTAFVLAGVWVLSRKGA
ncbi:MAG: DMT family transporter [Burkholderiaceae bacterium]|nr:DMT family transporter [Burkholderiaceae bacterium]